MSDLDPATDIDFLTDPYATARHLVEQFHLAESGYRLIVNGGKYQDFPYLYFHLISDREAVDERRTNTGRTPFIPTEN